MKSVLAAVAITMLTANVMAWDGSNNKYIIGGMVLGHILEQHRTREVVEVPVYSYGHRSSLSYKEERNRIIRQQYYDMKREESLDREYNRMIDEMY